MRAITVALLLGLAGLSARSTRACECDVRNASVADDRKASDLVITGQVLSVTYDESLEAYRAEVKIDKTWKGKKGERVTVYSRGGKMCGYLFEKGQRYLVFAAGKTQLFADACGRTKKLNLAKDDLRQLGQHSGEGALSGDH